MRKAGITFGIIAALAALTAQPAAAGYEAQVVVAKTDKGGSCRLEPLAARAGTSLTYGGRVVNCSARFGVRGAEGTGLLYEEPPEDKMIVDAAQFGGGNVPYERTDTFTEGEPGTPYRAVWEATVVINSRRSARRPKRPEHWIDPGRLCNVYTTYHAGDTLGCRLNQDF